MSGFALPVSASAADLFPQVSAGGEPPDTNYDESQVPPYDLPDPLVGFDGRKVSDATIWRETRRPEILRAFAQHVYGRTPEIRTRLRFERIAADSKVFDGLATRKQIRIRLLESDDAPWIDLLLYVPTHASRPAPVFLGLNYGNQGVHPDPDIVPSRNAVCRRGEHAHRWPLELLLQRGYAVASFHGGDLELDRHGSGCRFTTEGWQKGIRHFVMRKNGRTELADDEWGSIGAWAWGLSRALDYLQADPAIDGTRVAVFGHSRTGKTALWAGAQDERFALVISNNSGQGGAALARRRYGETVAASYSLSGIWYCRNYQKYGNNESALPVDSHMLIALIAPRPVYVASAEQDRWADPRGEFLAARHAEPVYTLLRRPGLEVAAMPEVDRPVGRTIGYHVRTGDHEITPYDWGRYLDFADRHLRQRRVLYNFDGDSCLWTKAGSPGPVRVTTDDVKRLIEEVTYDGSRVDTVLLCVNAQVMYYPTKVGTMRGTLSSPEERGQWPASEKQRFENLKAFFDNGTDPYGIMLAEAKSRGREALLTFRMNDDHGNDFLRTQFLVDHPDWRLGAEQYRGNGAMDFGRDEVRDYTFRLIDEAVRRYDCDGVELDFNRFPAFFKDGTADERVAKMNSLVERVRTMLDEVGNERRRRLVLGVRVPSNYGRTPPTPETARQIGCDVPAWVEQGWVDFVTVSEFLYERGDLPIDLWKQTISSAPVYGGIECTRGGGEKNLSADEYRRAATELIKSGADGVYLFNFFTSREEGENASEPPFEVLRDLGAPIGDPRAGGSVESSVIAWPAPASEALSEHYELTVDGQAVPVYSCRVSAVPFNQVWPGYQRPLDQTELAGFACWDMAEPVKVMIQSRRLVQSVVVRPASLGIQPVIEADRIAFDLERPGPVVVEVNGPHHALHLFASPPEQEVPAPDAPGVRYFGPGVHRVGPIELKSHETVYLAGGAVVYGSLHARGAENIRIAGRGILDVSPYPRGEGGGAVRLSDCSDVRIEGIVMRDPDVWCCSLFGCRNVTVANVKLVGLWRYNADGIDVCNSQDVEVRDCFVRAFDDALVIKGLKFQKDSFDGRPVRNVRFRRCVVWCDWGRAMEIGAETCAPEIADVVFEDCDIVRTTHIAMDIQHGDRAVIRDIRFENIRVEIDHQNPQPRMQRSRGEQYSAALESRHCPTLMEIVIRKNDYSRDVQRGTVQDVIFAEIAVTSPLTPPSSFRGLDSEHGVEGVTIANLRVNDQPLRNAAEARLQIGAHVRSVKFADAVADGFRVPRPE